MMRLLVLFLALATVPLFGEVEAAARDTRVFELRTYHAAPGKLDDLLTRFRDHTCALFEKHGMTNIGYWVPVENEQNVLIYLLAYPDPEARVASWAGFLNDPEWQKAYEESHAEGVLVEKIDQLFLGATGYSPSPGPALGEGDDRLFEMRTYRAARHRLPALHSRFREHTLGLFEKHGITNLGYFQLLPGQPGADETLLYFVAHDNAAAARTSWKAFGADPQWQSAKRASEAAAGGSLTAENGVQSIFLTPTDFSPTR